MGEHLSQEDMFLMMRSYENTVRMNTQLFERQEVMLREQDKMVENLSELTIKQKEINRQLGTLVTNLTSHNSSCGIGITEVTRVINEGHISNVTEHGKLRYHLITISGGLVVVIIALIVALEKIWSKSDIIDAVAKYIGI